MSCIMRVCLHSNVHLIFDYRSITDLHQILCACPLICRRIDLRNARIKKKTWRNIEFRETGARVGRVCWLMYTNS